MKHTTRLGRYLTLIVVGCGLLASGIAVAAASSTPTSAPLQLAQTGFPNAGNTGVPAGMRLTRVNGDFTTTSNGQTIRARLITGNLVIRNNNVHVTYARILGRIVDQQSQTGLSLTDSTVGPTACPARSGNYQLLMNSNYTLLRVHFQYGVGDDLLRQGGHGGSITVTDSLFDHTCWYTGSHLDAFQMYDPGDVSHALLNHDTLNSRPVNHSGTGDAAIFWADHPGAGSTLEVEHSMLAGGDYTTALYDATAGSGVVINVHNNVYVNHSWNYGPCDSNSVRYNGHEGLRFVSNVLDTGAAVTC